MLMEVKGNIVNGVVDAEQQRSEDHESPTGTQAKSTVKNPTKDCFGCSLSAAIRTSNWTPPERS
jgi:hypothetical protein